uniref:Uncharacterized protein n=1 Tax=Oryza glumipatula TaxID=40148 RepID=A0A0D9Z720_9ORYZ
MCAHLPAVRRSSVCLPALLFVHCSFAHLLMLLSVRCSPLAAPPLHQIWLTEGDDVGRGGGTRQHGGSVVLVAAPSAELVAVKLFASSSLAGSGSAHAISEDVWAQRWPEIKGGMVGRGGGCSSKSDSSGAIPSVELVIALSFAGRK